MENKLFDKMEKSLICNVCDYKANRHGDFVKHIKTKKHVKNVYVKEGKKIDFLKNECSICNYITSNKKDYKKHLLTLKHKKNEELNKLNNEKIINIDNGETNYKELLVDTMRENKEMRKFMIKQYEIIEKQQQTINEIIPKIGNNTINTINSNNKFNLNIFLNETCRDAISMDEFINKVQVSLSNLFYTKEKGIAQGVSNIFIENLNKLPLTQRPIHCTDVKRETIYIKNKEWEKDEKKEKTKEAIKKVSTIQVKNINKFKDAHPNFMQNENEKDNYISIVRVATSDIDDKQEKIIKNICKEVYVNDGLIAN